MKTAKPFVPEASFYMAEFQLPENASFDEYNKILRIPIQPTDFDLAAMRDAMHDHPQTDYLLDMLCRNAEMFALATWLQSARK